jgi:D-alanyl-D-alanine-carboxypeptidase/D-alanyl-D-alanine-endopeptidase
MAGGRRIRRRVCGIAAAIAGAAATLALAACQPKPPDAAAVGSAGQTIGRAARIEAETYRLYLDSDAVGLVATVVRDGKASVSGFGHVGPTGTAAPDGRTLVRLQSISKLLDSDLLSALVAGGQVRLTDPLTLYAPSGWQGPPAKPGAPPITLLTLATHTSGLPREAAVIAGKPGPEAQAERWEWLATQTRLPPVGRGALYSNIGFDLLGDALAAAAKVPYETALAATVTQPLGMADTTAQPTAAQCARMLAPDPLRHPFPCVDQSWEAASGGIYSTADDMGRWMQAQLAPGAATDRRRISQATYVQRASLASAVGLDHAGPAAAIGLAWIELAPTPDHPQVLEKTGGGDGFLTYIVIDPASRVGVFVAFDNVSGRRLPVVAADANVLVGLLAAAAEPASPVTR